MMNMKDFEFSQAHIHFWDKFERSNCFLESMIEMGNRDIGDRTVHFLSDPYRRWGSMEYGHEFDS